VITSTFENVSDIGVYLGLSLGPPASAGVRSKRGALHRHPERHIEVLNHEGARRYNQEDAALGIKCLPERSC
jgi:hypothetical protein